MWSDKVQTKPSAPHWPVAPFTIVAVNAGPCDAWLVLNIGSWSWWEGLLLGVGRGGYGGGGVHTFFFGRHPVFQSRCLPALIETRRRGRRRFMTRCRVLSTFSMALESQYCGALDTLVRLIGAGRVCVCMGVFIVILCNTCTSSLSQCLQIVSLQRRK